MTKAMQQFVSAMALLGSLVLGLPAWAQVILSRFFVYLNVAFKGV